MARRPRGTGSLFRVKRRRADGTEYESPVWRMQYYVNGHRVKESTRTADRAEAARALRRRLVEVESDLYMAGNPERVRVGALLDTLRNAYISAGRASLPQLESRMRKHLVPFFGKRKAMDLVPADVERYKTRRRRAGASDSAINRELEHLRAAFRLAVDDRILPRAPKIRMFREDNARTGFLESEQYLRLRDALPGYLRPLFITAYHTGGRLGELRAICWGQVDWAAHQIRLEARQTKGKAARVLPIYGEMQEVLAEALRHRNEWFPQCSLVFHRLGRPIGDFRKAWATACASAGVAITFHDLRRTAVRNMDRAGIPRDVAMRIIGHRTASMYSRYNIISERDLAEAGRLAEQYLAEERKRTAGRPEERVQ